MAPTGQLLAEAEGNLLHDLIGESVRVLEVGAAGEVGEAGKEPEEGAIRPLGHAVLRDGSVGAPRDEGEEAPGGGAAPHEFLDDTGKPELLIGGEERCPGAEGVGEELESLGAHVRVGEATGDLVLGAEVHLGDIGDLSVRRAFWIR